MSRSLNECVIDRGGIGTLGDSAGQVNVAGSTKSRQMEHFQTPFAIFFFLSLTGFAEID